MKGFYHFSSTLSISVFSLDLFLKDLVLIVVLKWYIWISSFPLIIFSCICLPLIFPCGFFITS